MDYSFFYRINFRDKFGGGKLIETLFWENLTFELFNKWK